MRYDLAGVKQALSKDVATNPIKLDRVLTAAGSALEWNGRGHNVAEYAFALRRMREDSIVMVKLQGGGAYDGRRYLGEQLQPIAQGFMASVRNGTVDAFVGSHPEIINRDK